MMVWLRRLFKVHQGEGKKIILFALLGGLLNAGVALGLSVSDSLFLANLGPEKLPYFFVFIPIIMLALVPLYAYWVNRSGIDRVFDSSLFILIAGSVFFFGVLQFKPAGLSLGLNNLLYFLIKTYPFFWMITFYTLYWNLIDGYFDIMDAKRLFAFFSGGMAAGAALGGGLVSFLTGFMPVGWLFLVWAGLTVLCWPLVRYVRARYDRYEDAVEDKAESVLEQVQQVGREVRRNRFVRMLNLLVFLTIFVTTLVEYQYSQVFSKLGNEQYLAALFGRLFLYANLFNLVVNFFFFNRLIALFGVRNLAVIQPLVYAGAFLFLYLDFGFNAALLGFFAYQGVMIAIAQNNYNFLYNAVPGNVKKQVRAFTEGLADPMATSMAGLLLLFMSDISLHETLSLIALFIAAAAFFVSLILRHDYRGAIVNNLKGEWLDFSRSGKDVLEQEDPAGLRVHIRNADIETRLALLPVLRRLDSKMADELLFELLEGTEPELQERYALLTGEILAENDPKVLRRFLSWLNVRQPDLSEGMMEQLAAFNLLPIGSFADKQEENRYGTAKTIARLYSWKLKDNLEGLSDIDRLLSGDEATLKDAIRAVGLTRIPRYAYFLRGFLQDSRAEIRLTALRSIVQLTNRDLNRLLPGLMQIVMERRGEERLLAIQAISKLEDTSALPQLLEASDTFSPRVRREVEQFAAGLGLKAVPTVISILRGSRNSYRARGIAARILGKLAFAQFEQIYPDLIQEELEQAYRYLYFHYRLEQHSSRGRGYQLLSRYYRDIQRRAVLFVLELLTMAGRLPDLELIASSIRSTNPKRRGNAIETLEQGVPRPIFRRLLPLVDSRSIPEKISWYQAHYHAGDIDLDALVHQAVNGRQDLETAAALQILWESGEESLYRLSMDRMRTVETPLLRETVLSFLDRNTVQGAVPQHQWNGVEKLAAFAEVEIFQQLELVDLVAVVQRVVPGTGSAEDIPRLVFHFPHRGETEVYGIPLLTGRESEPLPELADDACFYLPLSALEEEMNILPELGIRLFEKLGELV